MKFTLSDESRKYLLTLARQSIELGLNEEELPAQHPGDPNLNEKYGAFVTLKINGKLRGCIGRMEASQPLWQTVATMARAAAFEDPRFPALVRRELGGVTLEISVLTPFEPLTGPEALVVGQHGLLIEKGYHRGVLLPQVAVEQGWGAGEFLEQVCLKASLDRDAWKDPETRLFVFSALVFSE